MGKMRESALVQGGESGAAMSGQHVRGGEELGWAKGLRGGVVGCLLYRIFRRDILVGICQSLALLIRGGRRSE